MPPKQIGPYNVLETLGAGGAGTVYRAVDRRTGEPAALKLLTRGPTIDPKQARRLAREFETLAKLSHPNVVRVFDTGVYQGYPYLAMELVEGLTLRPYLAVTGSGPMTPSSVPKKAPPAGENTSPSADSLDVSEDSSDDEDDAGVGGAGGSAEGGARKRFTMSAFGDENPSEEVNHRQGPDSVRAWADEADEPDTHTMNDISLSLPYDLPQPHEIAPRPAKAPDVTALNQPERMGRLKDAILQLCQALSYIHAHGVIHRDLKPSNVMVDDDHIVRLMDFGLAKYLADDGPVTATGQMVGTFRYMAPEQIMAEPLDGRSDLYSLGVILYELLTGKPPFDAKTPRDLWNKVLESEAPPVLSLNPQADAQLARVAHRLMRKEPDDRYQTAEEVYDAISE